MKFYWNFCLILNIIFISVNNSEGEGGEGKTSKEKCSLVEKEDEKTCQPFFVKIQEFFLTCTTILLFLSQLAFSEQHLFFNGNLFSEKKEKIFFCLAISI